MNNVICIIGMHRSGTSLIARVLNLCGLDLGPSEQFMEPNEANPLGYFENVNFTYKIDDALLAHFGGSWDNPPPFEEGWEYDPSLEQIVYEAKSLLQTFSNNSQWGWKDPRATILLPFWKLLIPDLRFVICVRSPLEVDKSLASRDGIPIQKGVYLWNQYMRAAIRDTEGCPRIFTFYEDFFKDAPAEIKRVVEFCGLQMPDDLSNLYDVISPELKHHTSETFELLNEDELITEYKLFYIGLRALTTEGFVQSTSDRTREAFVSENISRFFKLLEQFHDEQEMAKLQSTLADKEQQITRLYAMVHQQQQAQSKKEEQVAQLIAQQGILNQVLKDLQAGLNQKDEQVGQLQTTVQAQQQVLGEKEQQIAQLTAEKEKKILQLSAERERLYREASQYQAIAHDQQQALDAFCRNKLLRAYWRIKDKLSFIRKTINLVTWVKSQHLDANNKACFCNVCGWEGKAFIGIRHPESLHCPECGSISRDRMLYEAFLAYLREDCGVNKSFLLDDTHIPYRIIETSPRMTNPNLRNSYKKRMIEICDQYIEIGFNMKNIKANYLEDPQNLTFFDASIDFILSSAVITHVADDRRAYNEVFRVLKDGGVAFFQMQILNFQTTVAQNKEYYNDNTPVIRRNGWDVVDKMRDAGFDVSILVCDECFLCFESFPSNDFTLFDLVTFNSKYGHTKESIAEYPFVSLIQKDRQMKLAIYPFGAHEVFKCYKQPLNETDE